MTLDGWPNPVRSSARLAYVLPGREERVDVAIFDTNGRVVRSLRLGPQNSGSHAWIWDGRANEGHAGPAGVYYARLLAGKRSLSRKLLKLNP